MSQLLESIRLENGAFSNLNYHERRMQQSVERLFHVHLSLDLAEVLGQLSPPAQGLYKCRVVYSNKINKIEFIPYEPVSVGSLKCIRHDDLSYDFKFEDRSELKADFEKRGSCDDILIIKNGLVTDSSYANIIFKQNDIWFTPESFLLPGTQRQYLLDNKLIVEKEIRASSVREYSVFKLINSMLRFNGPEVGIEMIING